MTNANRAYRAADVLDTYGEEPEDRKTTVTDLMADIMHLLKREKKLTPLKTVEAFEALVALAEMHFEAEV